MREFRVTINIQDTGLCNSKNEIEYFNIAEIKSEIENMLDMPYGLMATNISVEEVECPSN